MLSLISVIFTNVSLFIDLSLLNVFDHPCIYTLKIEVSLTGVGEIVEAYENEAPQ